MIYGGVARLRKLPTMENKMRLSTMYFIGAFVALVMCVTNAVTPSPIAVGMMFGFIFGGLMGWAFAQGLLERRKGN